MTASTTAGQHQLQGTGALRAINSALFNLLVGRKGKRAGRILMAAGLALCLLLWRSSASIHLNLCITMAMATVAGLYFLIQWARDNPGHRIVVFRSLLLAPTALLAMEAVLSYMDWREGWRTAPLRVGGMFESDPVFGYKLIPSRRYDLWGGQVAVDRNGFRSSSDVALAKDPSRIRVMLLGGSSAFGWCVPDGHDIAAHLQLQLNTAQTNRQFEVINAAVPYYTSFQELNRYLHALANFEPDILISVTGRNDLWAAACEGKDWRPVQEGGVGPVPLLARAVTMPEYIEAGLMRSAVYRRIFWRTQRLLEGPPPEPGANAAPDQVYAQAVRQFARHENMIAAFAERNATRFVVALQPTIYHGKLLTENEVRLSRLAGERDRAMHKWWPAMQAAPVQSDAFVDLTDVFAEYTQDAYADTCHYTSEGNRLIAAKLAHVVLKSTR